MSMGLVGSLAITALVCLLSFLIVKELVGVNRSSRLRLLARGLNVGIVPFSLIFGVIVFFKIIALLQ